MEIERYHILQAILGRVQQREAFEYIIQIVGCEIALEVKHDA